jgi:integrase/recombinase XerD
MASSAFSAFAVGFDPLRDKSYRKTALGRSVVDFLAWKRVGKAAERTLETYEWVLSRLCLMFPKLGVEEIEIGELVHVAASFPEASRRERLAVYRSFFKWAVRMRIRPDNPCDMLPTIARRQVRIEIFEDAEIARLCGLPLVDGLLFQILFDCGLRKEEACRLQLLNFRSDPAPGEVDVFGKGDKWRTLPQSLTLSQRLYDLVLLEGLEREDYLWYTTWRNQHTSSHHRKRQISASTFDRWYSGCLETAGVRYRNQHVTRHTFATRYLRRGGTMHHLSDAMGHVSIATTDHYYKHFNTRDLHREWALVFGPEEEV